MLNTFRLLRDEGDGGGSGGGAGEGQGGDAGGTSTTPPAGGAGAGEGQGGGGQSGAITPPAEPTTYEDAMAILKAEREAATKLKQDHETLNKEHKKVKLDFDKRSSELGAFKKLHESLITDPKTAIADLAKKSKINITFAEDHKTEMPDLNGEDAPEKFKQYMAAHDAELVAQVKRELAGPMGTMMEEQFRTKYGDWDNLADDRKTIRLEHMADKLTNEELLHLAAIGRNMPSALETAELRGREKYIAELAEKSGAGAGPGSGGEGPKGSGAGAAHDPATPETMTAAMARMRTAN